MMITRSNKLLFIIYGKRENVEFTEFMFKLNKTMTTKKNVIDMEIHIVP